MQARSLSKDKLGYLPMLLAIPVAALAVIVASSGSSAAGNRSFSPGEAHAIRRTTALLSGIPQHGPILGDPEAPVTLQFFGDLQCMDSRRVMLGALPFLIRHWVSGGKLRIVYRSTETDTLDGPEFRIQQGAAMAAGAQRKMWNFIDLFYREQRPEHSHYADDDFLAGIAEQAGVEMWQWDRDRGSDAWARQIESDEALAWNQELRPRSTPSFLIGPTGGGAHPLRRFSYEDPQAFDEAIRGLL
jgi:protein-disulfide isomerase